MTSNTMELKDKVAIIGIGSSKVSYRFEPKNRSSITFSVYHFYVVDENNPDSYRETKMKKTLTILHSGFVQTNFLAGIQNPAISICSEYRSSLQNETRNLGWNASEINRQTILLNQ